MRRLLIPSAALLWGFQFAFINPSLALLLVALFDATAAQVGWVLAIYNASGFVAALVVPAYADRRHDYLRPMLGCGLLTLILAGVLAATSSLPVAVIGLAALGGPASVGVSLLFAQVKAGGASRSEMVDTRAIISFAWVAGPPLASFIIGWSGNRAILLAIAVVAVLNVTVTAAMIAGRDAAAAGPQPADTDGGSRPAPRSQVALIVAAFIVLHATNSAVVSVMNLFVVRALGLDVVWAGVALGFAAALEIPALLLIGRLGHRVRDLALVAAGCVAGIAYYLGMVFVRGPVSLLGLQVLNAAFYAVVAGVGLSLFQQLIPRPGLAAGLYMNTRRVGAIASGPIIALGSVGALGYRNVFVACALLTAAALLTSIFARVTSLPDVVG